MASFDLEGYVPVQDRIREFWQDYPAGAIETFMVVRDGPEIIFEARVYRTAEDKAAGLYTSGWAREVEGKTPVNKTSHLENGETGAIGRALANLGYATDAACASRAEMLKVARMKEEHEQMLDFIRTVGPRVPEGASAVIGGHEVTIKEYVRKHWTEIKERFATALAVVEAIEAATETEFGASATEASA